jgi:tartrate-resistant acid phosphatase type 5
MKAACLVALLALAGASPEEITNSMRFLVMGDWGGTGKSPYTTSSEVNTAKSMDEAAKSLGAKFSLALGDNFYTTGVKSVTDPRFEETFEQCFTGSSLQASAGFNFHVVAGNHDHIGNAQAQVEYSSKSERWNFPSLWYDFKETAPDGATIHFVMIDTVVLSGNSQWNDEDIDPTPGMDLPGPANVTLAQSQMDFIKSTLAASTADFVVVGGHYPIFSPAEHGPTRNLQPSEFPYLRDYKVSAYLCGHEHSESYIDVGDGIQYHIIGSAHLGDSSMSHAKTLQPGQLKFHNADGGGFASVEVSKAGMQITHHNGAGKVLYTAPMIAPRSHSPPAPPSPPSPPPTPPSPPAGNWECHDNYKVSIGEDQDIQKTGSDITSCQEKCQSTDDCKAVCWHKTDNHCHLMVGSFSRDDFSSALIKDSSHSSCFHNAGANSIVV